MHDDWISPLTGGERMLLHKVYELSGDTRLLKILVKGVIIEIKERLIAARAAGHSREVVTLREEAISLIMRAHSLSIFSAEEATKWLPSVRDI